tara:strand:- start:254 stop:583 length:330 start_codon:yes stop_codon:yes gene_type:complete
MSHFGEKFGGKCWEEYNKKSLDKQGADQLNVHLERSWPDIQEKLSAVIIPSETLVSILQRAGAPVNFKDINLDEFFFADAVLHAREIRNRYTFLDLASDAGMMNPKEII